jgi:hypothetical protein
MSAIAFLDPNMPCTRCGHLADWHRTQTGECTHDLLDEELGSWIRCGCQGFMG